MSQPVTVDPQIDITEANAIRDGQHQDQGPRRAEKSTAMVPSPAFIVDPVWDTRDYSNSATSRQHYSTFGLSRCIEPFLVYKRWWIASLLVALLFGWAILLVWPRTYQSIAKLQLLVGRESVGLDPSSTTTQTLLMQKTMEEDVNSALEILGSRDLAQRVVNELGAENILNGSLPLLVVEQASPGMKQQVQHYLNKMQELVDQAIDWTGVRDSLSNNEYAIIELEDTVTISSPRKSSTIVISAYSKSPQMAQAIVQSYTKHFLERHMDVATTEGSKNFFSEQAYKAESNLQELLVQRSSLLQQHKMASAASRFNILTTHLATIETTIINSAAQIDQASSELGDLTRSIEQSEAEVVSAKQTQPDQAIVGMRNSLYAAELEGKRRAAIYKEGHPLLVQIEQQVEAARESLERLEQESESLSTTPNPLRQKLEEDQLKTRARVVGLNSLLEKSQSQLDQKQNEMNHLLEIELLVEQLDRQIEVSKKSLGLLREKEEQARIVDDLRKERISSIGLAQSATLIEKPVSPKKPLIAAALLLLGLGVGVGLVGLRELSRKTIRNAEDVQQWLGIPVLAETPHIRRIARRRFSMKDLKSRKLAPVRAACKSLYSELILSERRPGGARSRGISIGILGLDEDSGASLLATGLALECSHHSDRQTTLIDLDLQKRTVSSVFGLNGGPGIVEFAAGRASEADCVQQSEDSALHLVGSTAPRLKHASGSDVCNVVGVLGKLTEPNDYVIFDFPPASRPDQILQLAKELDQVVIVVRSEVTKLATVARVLERLQRANSNVAGIALTRTHRYLPKWLKNLIG